MKLLLPNERPSTLPAVWAQVFGVPVRSAAATARDLLVGELAARMRAAGTPTQAIGLARDRDQLAYAVASYGTGRTERIERNNGTNGFGGENSGAAKQVVGGVSGDPPRGRPV